MNLVEPVRDTKKIEDMKVYLKERSMTKRYLGINQDDINNLYHNLNI